MPTRHSYSKKRILVVCQRFWPENIRVNDVCDYFVEQGYKVDVLCGIPNYPKGKFYEGYGLFKRRTETHNNITVMRAFESPRGKNSNLGIILNSVSFAVFSLFHIPKLFSKKYDKIFIYQLSPVMMALPGILLGKLKRVETTMWVIDLWPDNLFSFLKIKNHSLRKIATIVSKWHYYSVDKLITTSPGMMQRITPSNKISQLVLPQACEKLFERSIKNPVLLKKFEGGFKVLFTGTLTPIISPDTIVSAAVILKNKGYKDLKWVIVGDGMSRTYFEQQVMENGLTDNFYFEGYQQKEKIPEYTTNAADVLLGTLVKDSYLDVTVPAKIASYLAAGKPIILSIDGEASRLINDSAKCGYATAAEDPVGLATSVEHVYNMSASERFALGKNARNYYDAALSRDVVMDKLLKFIEQ